jgi:hypothetical protein
MTTPFNMVHYQGFFYKKGKWKWWVLKYFGIEMKPIKKIKQPNWEYQEIISMVHAKWNERIASLDVIEPKDCFENVVMKYKVFATMMGFGHVVQMRNGLVHKENWATMYGNYKEI